ncbi:MAG: hypothetical protein DBX37_05800 [Massilioclostridium sp.]|nr:MAG: hypothetical protein DBX37_05800 [Massilioclostridium sp.]
MEIGELISLYRKQSKMTIDELVEKSGVPKGTLNKIIGGTTKAPTLDNMKSIAKALGKTLADFDDTPQQKNSYTLLENELIKKYRSLDDHGKKIVDLVLNEELERATEIIREDLNPKYKPALYSTQKFSAGAGTYLGVDDFETILIQDNEATKKVKFCGSVQGDSMEPLYHDGDILMVSNEPVEIGDIGIFTLDGNGYVKKRGIDDLISLNPDYDPIPMDDTIKCNGKVIGILNPEWIKDN